MAPTGLRERKKRRTEASIVEAAFGLFNERGFEAATIAEVAERAEAAVGTLYNYFESKSHILVAVLLAETKKYAEQAAEQAARTTHTIKNSSAGGLSAVRARLMAYSDAYLESYSSHSRQLWLEMFSGLFKGRARADELFSSDSNALGPISTLITPVELTDGATEGVGATAMHLREALTIHSVIMAALLQYITDERVGLDEAKRVARERIRQLASRG
ncbi:MAG: helix-turn-helix transcriptional regulator [Proteobacteria bacterium]|nr:helix-turn-helix transcriptional regulator [Pseudomonadota bacterium]